MWRRPTRASSPLDGPAAGTPSMTSRPTRGLRDPPSCRRAWRSSASTSRVKRERTPTKARTRRPKTRGRSPRTAKPQGPPADVSELVPGTLTGPRLLCRFETMKTRGEIHHPTIRESSLWQLQHGPPFAFGRVPNPSKSLLSSPPFPHGC